jgi:hypothetical protein
VDRFATSNERAVILGGLLRYRSALHAAGVVSGFQWLNGNSSEDVETTEARPPNDIDVVTFFELPPGETQGSFFSSNWGLFERVSTKSNYKVDAFPQVLAQKMTEPRIRSTVYWYSMWGHQRSGLWKGYVQVDLSPTEDASAAALLAVQIAKGFPQWKIVGYHCYQR